MNDTIAKIAERCGIRATPHMPRPDWMMHSSAYNAKMEEFARAVAEECARMADDPAACLRMIHGRAHPAKAVSRAIRAAFGVTDSWLLDKPGADLATIASPSDAPPPTSPPAAESSQ